MTATDLTPAGLALLERVGLVRATADGAVFEMTREARTLLAEKAPRPRKLEPLPTWLARLSLLAAGALVGCGGAARSEEVSRDQPQAPAALELTSWSIECSYVARATDTPESVLLVAAADVSPDGWVDATFELSSVLGAQVDSPEPVADFAPRSSDVAGHLRVAGAEFVDVGLLGTVTLTLDFDAETFAAALNGNVFRILPFSDCEIHS